MLLTVLFNIITLKLSAVDHGPHVIRKSRIVLYKFKFLHLCHRRIVDVHDLKNHRVTNLIQLSQQLHNFRNSNLIKVRWAFCCRNIMSVHTF